MKTYLLGKRIGAPEILLVPVSNIPPVLAFPIYDWRTKIAPALLQSAPGHFSDLATMKQTFPGQGGIWNDVAAVHLAKVLRKVTWQVMLEPVRNGLIDFLGPSGGFSIVKEEPTENMGTTER